MTGPNERIKKIVAVALLIILSSALRIYKINQGLWYDEITTLLNFVRLPWLKIIMSLPLPNNHLLFTLLAKLSIVWLGEKEWTLRLPSLIIGSLTPPLAYWVLRKKTGELTAFLTGTFLALSFWPVWFSQDARGYAGQILFTLLSQVFFLDWIEARARRGLIIYWLSSMLAVGFHLYSAFVIAAQIGFGFFAYARNRNKNRLMILAAATVSLVLSLLIYLPGAPDLIGYLPKEGHDVAGRWLDLNFVKELIGLFSSTHILVLGLGLGIAALFGLYRLFRKWPEFCSLYLLSALLLVLFTLVMQVFIYARFLAFMVPFFYLCLAEAVSALKFSRLARTVLTVLVAVALAVSLGRYYRLGKQGLKDAAQYLEAQYPLAPVVSLGLARNEFLYYCPQAQPVFGQVAQPPQVFLGKMVVASHPWSWAPWNEKMLERNCRREKVWPSAGYDENEVFLYNCLGQGGENGPAK